MKPSLAIFLGHDAAIAVTDPANDRIIQIELEKIIKEKHYQPSLKNKARLDEFMHVVQEVIRLLKRDYDIDNDFKYLLHKGFWFKESEQELLRILGSAFKNEEMVDMGDVHHHLLHARSAYVQSPFRGRKALALTYDGGGDTCFSGRFGIDRHELNHEELDYLNIGWLFCNLPDFLPFSICLKPSPGGGGRLARSIRIDTAGKLMGLSAYGHYTTDAYHTINWYMKEIYPRLVLRNELHGNMWPGKQLIDHYRARFGFPDKFPLTQEQECQIAWELQELAKIMIKTVFDEYIVPIAKKYDNHILISGGCGMNVIVNQMLRELYPNLDIFVPSNPGDAGLALGMLADFFKRDLAPCKDPHLSDLRLMDLENVPALLEERGATEIDLEDFSDIIEEGKIVGFIDGGIEVGARSLCRRSILASASYPGMKDKINEKVKHREWYRPFAPVVRDKDVQTYFKSPSYRNLESMNYALETREMWREKLSAVNHIDNTARVQALRKHESPWIYALLDKRSPYVLLNTSFNIGGKPILNTLEDALWILDNRDLDHLIIVHENKLMKIDKTC